MEEVCLGTCLILSSYADPETGGPKIFSIVLKIGENLTSEEWQSKVVPVIVRLFSIPDRAIRVFLLDNLPKMIDHIPPKVVNDKIFLDMVTGFSDVAPVVREQTVKAVLVIINKVKRSPYFMTRAFLLISVICSCPIER